MQCVDSVAFVYFYLLSVVSVYVISFFVILPLGVPATSLHLLRPRRVVPIYRDILPFSPHYLPHCRLFNTFLSKYLLTQFLHINFGLPLLLLPPSSVFHAPFINLSSPNFKYVSCPGPTTFSLIHVFILITSINSLHPSSFCHLALLFTKIVMPHDMDTNLALVGTYYHPRTLRQCQRPSHAPGNIRTERSRSQTSDRKDSCRWLQAPTCSQTVPGYHLRACTDSLDLQGNIHRVTGMLSLQLKSVVY